MNVSKVIRDLEKLVQDCLPVVADVEAIVADINGSPSLKAEFDPAILQKLLEAVEAAASNPVVQALVMAILKNLLKTV